MAANVSKIRNLILGPASLDVATTTQYFDIGQTCMDSDGCVFEYGCAGEALTGQSYVVWRTSSAATWSLITTTLAATGGYGGGVATNAAVASGSYFWVCVRKPPGAATRNTVLGLRTDANVAADIVLQASSTSGQLVASTLTSSVRMHSVGLQTATPTTAAATNTSAWWDYFGRVGF